jgi:uncharacterized protein (DUF58 family)
MKKWFKWLFAVLFILGFALVFQLGLLAYAMYVLLGLLVLSRWLAHAWMENLTATRKCDRVSAQIGESATVQVTVKNPSKLPVVWVLLEDQLPKQALQQRPPRINVDGKRLKISLIKGENQTKLKYDVRFDMRGYYQIGPLVMESGDLFGLHRRYRVAAEPQYVLVYPKVVPLQGYDLASRRPIGEVRMSHRLYEDPTRIAGVRGYLAGDPLNRVHWRATARTGELQSKVYEPSTIAGATILLDFHKDSYHRRGEPYRSETAVTVAASLANAVYELGQQVGLITNGRDAADRIRQEGWDKEFRTRIAAQTTTGMKDESDRLQPLLVPTRRGPEQLMRILEMLARVELTDGLTLDQLIFETSSRMPRDATVIAILGNVAPETALVLGSLRQRGFAVTAVLVIFEEKALEEAYGRLRAERIEVRILPDETALAGLCQQQVLRG